MNLEEMAAGREKHPPIAELLGLEVVTTAPGFLSCRAVPPPVFFDGRADSGEAWALAVMSLGMNWLLDDLLGEVSH